MQIRTPYEQFHPEDWMTIASIQPRAVTISRALARNAAPDQTYGSHLALQSCQARRRAARSYTCRNGLRSTGSKQRRPMIAASLSSASVIARPPSRATPPPQLRRRVPRCRYAFYRFHPSLPPRCCAHFTRACLPRQTVFAFSLSPCPTARR